MNQHSQFEDKIRRNVVDTALRENSAPSFGIILSYDQEAHSATVIVARPGSQQLGETYYNVPCPQVNGVQFQAPEPGRPCWLGFPSGTKTAPVITAFFNPNYSQNDFKTQNHAVNDVPRFMTEM